jgi:hypothetical protein
VYGAVRNLTAVAEAAVLYKTFIAYAAAKVERDFENIVLTVRHRGRALRGRQGRGDERMAAISQPPRRRFVAIAHRYRPLPR